MSRTFCTAGALLALLFVAAGAVGAHALETRVDRDLLAAWETGARYGLYHAMALLVLALAMDRWPGSLWVTAGLLLAGGLLLFSGSLFALVLTGVGELGVITPLGGALFLLGWLGVAVAAWRNIPAPG